VDILQRELEEEVLNYLSESEKQEIQEKDAVFSMLTENFTCELGKVSRIESDVYMRCRQLASKKDTRRGSTQIV
jgi:hypothetical protein